MTEAPAKTTTEALKVECSKSPNGKHNWQEWYEPKEFYVGCKCHCNHCGYEWIASEQEPASSHICDDGAVSGWTSWDEYDYTMEYAYTYCTYCGEHK